MQPYPPPISPSFEKESHIDYEPASVQTRLASDAVVRNYEEKQKRLSNAIDATKYLVADLKNFNGGHWNVRYPHLTQSETSSTQSETSSTDSSSRPGLGRRTLTFADEPNSRTEVVVSSTVGGRHQLKRSATYVDSSPALEAREVDLATNANEDFSILRLDLNLGATRQAKALISHLERTSISALLDTRLSASLDHLSLLHTRILDAHSRVLVTGDLNAGKSTLVNALLRRPEVMPTDQQPLTTRFVEVVSARENHNKEEIHLVKSPERYSPIDSSTYTAIGIDHLEQLATDLDNDASAPPVRVFLRDSTDSSNPSILHNGVVDISLIDAPGLNRDSVKTTANFARQEEIDVVVFVVSAANHFTLSAKEFIWQAGHEKAHLFIVVNRFDQIKDKERCRRLVLDQIQQLSPKTYEDAADLVHFVDSAQVALGLTDDNGDSELDAAFSHLEHSLRSFVLVNRAKSKLGPAQNYITHLLSDVELLSTSNSLVAMAERDSALDEVSRVKPELDAMKRGKESLEESLVGEEETAIEQALSGARQSLNMALDRIGRGELGLTASGLTMPIYPGIIGAWDYAREVRRVLLTSLDSSVRVAEEDARKLTSNAVNLLTKVGDKYLPADVERSKRVFNPNAMFFHRTSRNGRRVSGLQHVGLGLVGNSDLAEVAVSDLFDVQYQLFLAQNPLAKPSPVRDLIPSSVASEVSSLGAASLAVTVFSLAGGKTLTLRSVLEGVMSFSEFAMRPIVRQWAAPVLGIIAIGAVTYVIYDLPRSIPRNVGRHLRATLLVTSGSGTDADELPFIEAEAQRVTREVRKVMRLAAWDLRERFRVALDSRGEIVRQSEETARQATRALSWFAEAEERIEAIRGQLGMKL